MTANRWWVKTGARWIARIDSVKGHLSRVFQGMTGVSIASGALKYFGHSNLVAPFITLTAGALLAYAYLYSEGGVWNQVNKDRLDLSDDFAGPGMFMGNMIRAESEAAALEALANGEDPRQAASDVVHEKWLEFRDGINPGEVSNAEMKT